MNKRLVTVLAFVLVFTVFVSTAFAWRAVRSGRKNFERAWSAFQLKRDDLAQQYYATGAGDFATALAEDPPSRTTMFPSNLTMAGMSFYNAGRYQDCVNAMDKALSKDKDIWEGPLYKGLSYAVMDDKAEAIKSLTAFMQSGAGQAIIANAVTKELTNLQTDSGTLSDAISTINAAVAEQFRTNYQLQSSSNPVEYCNGQYWWRYNKQPCAHKIYIDN